MKSNRIFFPRLLASTAAAALTSTMFLVLGTPAHAGANSADVVVNADNRRSTVVRFADLNISSEAGSKALYYRLRKAAREVCDYSYERNLASMINGRACVATALDGAIEQLNGTKVAALHRQSLKTS